MATTFDTTRWTLILQAATSQTTDGMEALDELCRRYWKPLHAYVCSRGCTPADAEDITQAFFQRLLANKIHTQADPDRGRFRTFLLHSLQNFIINEHRDASRQKRGGDVEHHDIEDVAHELATHSTPETIYEQKWAQAVLAAALDRMRSEFESAGHALRFQVMRPLLSARTEGDAEPLAAQLGATVSNFRKLLHHFRRRFGEHIRNEVRRLVANPADVDDEIAYLMKVLEG